MPAAFAIAVLAVLTSSSPTASPTTSSVPSSAPAVTVLPFLADGAVSVKQAHGVTALVRTALEDALIAKVLAENLDDDRNSQQCQREAMCLGKVADARGADEIVSGSVAPGADGLHLSLIVVRARGHDVMRRAETALQGNDDDTARIDRVVRTLIDPSSLRGMLVVTGEAGASVVVDGANVGALPLDPIELPEGDHTVSVAKPGYDTLTRKLAVVHRGTQTMRAVLLGTRDDASSLATTTTSSRAAAGSHTGAVVVGAIGVSLVVLGAGCGAVSLHDSLDVENRAKAQQLSLPADAGLLQRGQILAYTADGLYAAGVVAGGAAVALWLLDGPASEAGE